MAYETKYEMFENGTYLPTMGHKKWLHVTIVNQCLK